MKYYFGFSWRGLIVFLLPMIPNLVYFFIPAQDVSGSQSNSHIILDVLEHGSQVIFIFLLLFFISNKKSKKLCSYTMGMAGVLAFYYVHWIVYFIGNANFVLLLGMAVLPVVYFIVAEIWLHNYLAIIPTILFGVFHVMNTYMDFFFINQ